jgi:hypothetical protein
MIAFGVELNWAADLGAVVSAEQVELGFRLRVLYYAAPGGLADAVAAEYAGAVESPGVFYDAMPTAPVLDSLEQRVPAHKLRVVEVAAASAQFREGVRSRLVRGDEHRALEQALTFAVQRPLSTAFGFERKRVPCDMSPLNAAAFGLWGLRQHVAHGGVSAWTG